MVATSVISLIAQLRINLSNGAFRAPALVGYLRDKVAAPVRLLGCAADSPYCTNLVSPNNGQPKDPSARATETVAGNYERAPPGSAPFVLAPTSRRETCDALGYAGLLGITPRWPPDGTRWV